MQMTMFPIEMYKSPKIWNTTFTPEHLLSISVHSVRRALFLCLYWRKLPLEEPIFVGLPTSWFIGAKAYQSVDRKARSKLEATGMRKWHICAIQLSLLQPSDSTFQNSSKTARRPILLHRWCELYVMWQLSNAWPDVTLRSRRWWRYWKDSEARRRAHAAIPLAPLQTHRRTEKKSVCTGLRE